LRVVITRAAAQAEELAAPLRKLGFKIIVLPVIALVPPADSLPLSQAAARCDDYDWILFTSANAIEFFSRHLSAPPKKARVATIGTATRDAAEAHGLAVSLMPEEYVAEALLAALGSEPLAGCRILIPAAAVTRDVLPGELRARGAQVDVVEAYRNILPPDAAQHAPLIFRDPFPDAILFASPSAVNNLFSLVGEALRNTRLISIGPVTSAAVRKHGFAVYAEAEPHTVEGLVAACVMMQSSQS
jgi:uroporphyrinogen-III synthase